MRKHEQAWEKVQEQLGIQETATLGLGRDVSADTTSHAVPEES